MRKWWPLVAVCAGACMLLIDVTIVTVALPDMARQLNTTFSDLQWVIDLYALVLGALVLTVGAVADRLGRRRIYLTGLVLFAASSLACGLAPNVGVLIAARGVQGIGAAAMFATTMALISNMYSGRDRGMAFGVWGAVNGAASAVGPIAGGLLTANFGWRWIFLVNLPISVIAVVLTLRFVTESSDPHPRRVDLPGMVTFTVAAAALTYALIRGTWASGRDDRAGRGGRGRAGGVRRGRAPLRRPDAGPEPAAEAPVHRHAARRRAAERGGLGGDDLPVAVAAVGPGAERHRRRARLPARRRSGVPGVRAGRPVPAPDLAALDGRHRACW